MSRELIIPNLHVILIHFPLGVFLLGVGIELLSVFWRRHSVRAAGHWMVFLGAMSMIPTAMTGIYALRDAAGVGNAVQDDVWSNVLAGSPLSGEAWHALSRHAWLMAASTLLAVVCVLVYLGASDRLRRKLYGLLLVLLLISTGLMAVGAWYAGEAVYRHQVGVQVKGIANAQTDPRTAPGVPSTAPTTQMDFNRIDEVAASGNPKWVTTINTLFPPIQLHVTMAGLSVAIALASVALAFRRITQVEEFQGQTDTAEALVKSLTPDAPPAELYVGRWWMVASAAFLLTAAGGWYILASESETWRPSELWALVRSDGQTVLRRFAHVIGGVSLVALPLVMALIARFAPRNKALLAAATLILAAIITAQVWFGALMLFDTIDGPLTRMR